jgi:arylsulfatase A-like enzyme
MKILIPLLLVLGVLCGSSLAASRPNVLFISIDDLNDYISPLDNHPGIRTPNFDRLAKRSVTFANAHCAAPACHPSRVAVMTGVHPIRSGIYRNMFGAHGPRWRHESKVLEKAVVLSQHFRDHGYRAVGGGKIFHTLQWTPGDSQNDPDAWDDYRGDPLDPISADWPRPSLVPDSKAGLGAGRPLGGEHQLFGAAPLELDKDQGDGVVVDWAVEQMNRPTDKPLFLAVGLFRPHIPWEVPQQWFDMYPESEVQLPPHRNDDLSDAHRHGREGWHKWVTDNQQWKHLMRGYLASISYVDHELGRLLDGLDTSPIAKNTIVVLWTDHGFHIGEKENWEKFALWDQTTRVPLFIHAPGISRDGAKTRQPTTLTDVYPTLCELAGLPIPKQCDGASLVPQLMNPATQKQQPALTSFQFGRERTPSHAVADRRYRLIRYGNGFEELYDLENDPNEFTNRIDDPALADIRKRLTTSLPKKAVPNAKIPTDSPYHRGRGRGIPQIANVPLRITLEAIPEPGSPNGVLAAHGGDWHGYSVFVQDGSLKFAIRHNRVPSTIQAKTKAPDEPFHVRAVLDLDGRMKLFLDGMKVAEGKADGPITTQPNDGPSIGSDLATGVANYQTPFTYPGKVNNVRIMTPRK